MGSLALITSSLPLDGGPLPAPRVVASITTDKALLGNANPTTVLAAIAAKLGLFHYAIIDSEDREVPGYQFDLFTH